ncbi:DUF262 domain-containing protein [Pontibacter beigongshangensis]|uniref:DUF262 domain-containing protein n=1 Tax=Pontibacter beigongshangensis TaxID=2574733 RepID=UPI001650C0CD|nr:DUF262 domain-containing protein [Pontibacter beigongshangensis]
MDLTTVDNLLKHGIFTIPEYQRGYSWTKEQIQEFKDDLEDVEYVKEHYTGTITLIRVENGDEKIGIKTRPKYDIVDGQQRLTTIHLFLISLYFRLKKLGKADEEIINNVIFKDKTFLRLNDPSNQNFLKYLITEEDIKNLENKTPQNKTQKNLIFARIYFEKYFERIKERKALQLYDNLLSKFKVNIFELEQEAEVGLIFETMNDRGLPLSDIDKIKNYLVYVCHRLNKNKLAIEVNRKFGELFSDLMKIRNFTNITKLENQFLKDSYLVFTGQTKDLGDIHKKVKTDLIPKKIIHKDMDLFDTNEKLKESKVNDIKDFINFLVKSAKEYKKLSNQTFESKEINDGLHRLRILNKLDAFIPILLAVMTNPKYKLSYLKPILDILEVLAIRLYCIGDKKANTGQQLIYELAYKVKTNKINFTDLKKELRSIIAKYNTNNDFKNAIVNKQAYNDWETDTIKYFLYEYEVFRTLENRSSFTLQELKKFFDCKNYTVEHIHSQNSIPGEKSLMNTHYLGNLVITKNNGQLTNKDFNSKKKIYSNSELTSKRDIAEYDVWDDKMIIQRGKLLAKFAVERWKN